MRRFIIPLLERVNYGGKYRLIHYQKVYILDIMTKPITFEFVFNNLTNKIISHTKNSYFIYLKLHIPKDLQLYGYI